MSLSILNYSTPFFETQSKNGHKKIVHYIVKNTPFELKIRIPPELFPLHSFKSGVIECKLLLDQSGFKEVDYVKSKPLEYEILPVNDGRECVVRFRVKVLSTYFEKSLFVINLKLRNGEKIIECLTDSFKSVSKQTQIQKKITEVKGISKNLENPSTSSKSGLTSSGSRKKKRTKTDELLEVLEGIRGEQQQHTEILNRLMYGENHGECQGTNHSGDIENGSPSSNHNGERKDVESNMNDEEYFQHCMLKLMESYSRMDGNERPTKMRKVLKSNPVFNNSIQMFYDIQKEISPPMSPTEDCPNINCPFREQIVSINSFYTDMLNEPTYYDTTLVGL